MKRLFTIFILCGLLSFSASAITEQQKKDVIAKINQTSASIETMAADFTQTKNLSLLNDKMVSEGKIYYKRPDKLRWEYISPYDYLFIFNGTKVYVGNKSRKDVIDTSSNKIFKEVARIMMSTVTGTALSNTTDFTITVDDSGNLWKVTLVPKKKELRNMFSKVVLSFNKANYQVSEIDIFEKNNDRTNIKFRNLKVNKQVDASLFNIPK